MGLRIGEKGSNINRGQAFNRGAGEWMVARCGNNGCVDIALWLLGQRRLFWWTLATSCMTATSDLQPTASGSNSNCIASQPGVLANLYHFTNIASGLC